MYPNDHAILLVNKTNIPYNMRYKTLSLKFLTTIHNHSYHHHHQEYHYHNHNYNHHQEYHQTNSDTTTSITTTHQHHHHHDYGVTIKTTTNTYMFNACACSSFLACLSITTSSHITLPLSLVPSPSSIIAHRDIWHINFRLQRKHH